MTDSTNNLQGYGPLGNPQSHQALTGLIWPEGRPPLTKERYDQMIQRMAAHGGAPAGCLFFTVEQVIALQDDPYFLALKLNEFYFRQRLNDIDHCNPGEGNNEPLEDNTELVSQLDDAEQLLTMAMGAPKSATDFVKNNCAEVHNLINSVRGELRLRALNLRSVPMFEIDSIDDSEFMPQGVINVESQKPHQP